MFRQPGRGDEPAALPLPPDLTLRLTADAASTPLPAATVRRLPAHSRDERRLARIDRKVAARDTPAG
jgi:hypothetical protein